MGLFSLIGGIISGNKQAKAATQAAKLQYDAAMAGVNEAARQFDTTRADYTPALGLLAPAAQHLGNLTGINGGDAMSSEINSILSGPRFGALYDSGRDAILANASATGGLRGGNTEDALARFRRDTLSDEINRQLSEYSGLVGIGTGAAGAVGNFGANAVANQAAMRSQGAGAQAQAALVRGGIAGQNWQNVGTGLDSAISAALGGGFASSKLGTASSSSLGGGGFNWKTLF